MSKAQAFLSLLTDGGNTGFWSYCPGTQRIEADSSTCKLLQCDAPAPTLLTELLSGLHPEDQTALHADVLHAVQAQGSFARACRLQASPGDAWLSVRGRWSVSTGQAAGELLCVVERTQPTLLQDPHYQRLERIRSVLAESPVTLFEQDVDLRYLWALAPRMGLKDEVLTGHFATEFLEPESALAMDSIKRSVMDRGKPRRVQMVVKAKGHAGANFDIYIAPTQGPDGKVNGVISVSVDMAESQLREKRLLAIFERAPVAIALKRVVDGSYVMANDLFLNMMGYSREEVIGANSIELNIWNPPGDRARMLTELQATGHVRNLVSGFRHKSGRMGRALMSVEQVEIGGEALLVGMLTDITELEVARQALAASEARYKLLSEASFEGVGLSKDGVLVDANKQLAKMMGVTRADLIGQPVTQRLLPAEVANAPQVSDDEGESFNEYRYLRPDGRQVVLEVNSKDLVQGEQVLRISALRDITEKREKDLALQRLHERFTRMMESNVVGMFVGGPGGEVFEANDYFLNMLGRTRQALEAGQLNWKDHTTPDTLDTSVNNVMQMQATGGSLPYEKEYLHADGSQVSALVALSLLSKNPTRGVAIVVDISDRKAAQNALVQANSQLQERTLQAERAEVAKTLFLSSVSHELRTPLHTVLGYVRLLHKQTSGDVQQQLGVVEHSSSQLLKLIDDLLEFNHTTIAPERLEPEDVELQGFLANLESIGSVAAADSGNRFVCHLGSGLPSAIVVDERRLVQVLRILIDNACKYTRAGTVTLSLSAEQLLRKVDGALRCRLRFAVSDTGRGITKSDIRRIFEPLNRGSDVSDRPGLGLGLAIAEHWIARMGGCIAVESAPGLGSEFSFVLELDSRFEAGPAPREKWPDTRSATQVHDTPAQLQVLPADLLESLGKLIHMGRLGRLHEWAKDLQEQYPAHRNAAQQVAYLASHAEVDALIALHRRWAALAVNPKKP